MVQAPARGSILSEYETKFAKSKQLHERARQVIPSGITHDGRHLSPFPPYIARAEGGHKWTADGQELIDYGVGHGSLLFGHSDPDIVSAMHRQLDHGTHYSAGHEGEIAWAEKVVELVPSAEMVRFTGSGTEATLLAMRVARGYTQKTTILKFEGHFHGWQDYALKGETPPFERTFVPGIPAETLGTVAVVPSNDLAMLEERLSQGDIAGVILEPSGGSWATLPLKEDFLKNLRALTTKYSAVLIFDEVITGFRWSPGGAQQRFGVTPDLTTMAKIVAGGMPGGAVGGKREIMEMIEFRDAAWNTSRRIRQAGTYNANPLAAAAGVTCLTKASDPAVQRYCDDLAVKMRTGLNQVFSRRGLPGFAWGESSAFHISIGQTCTNRTDGDLHSPAGVSVEDLKSSGSAPLAQLTEVGMMLEGIHLFHTGGMFCTAHTDADVQQTVDAFDRVLGRLDAEGAFA